MIQHAIGVGKVKGRGEGLWELFTGELWRWFLGGLLIPLRDDAARTCWWLYDEPAIPASEAPPASLPALCSALHSRLDYSWISPRRVQPVNESHNTVPACELHNWYLASGSGDTGWPLLTVAATELIYIKLEESVVKLCVVQQIQLVGFFAYADRGPLSRILLTELKQRMSPNTILKYFWSTLCTRKHQHIVLTPTLVFLIGTAAWVWNVWSISPNSFPSSFLKCIQAWEPYSVYSAYQNTLTSHKGCLISTRFCWTPNVDGTIVCYHISLLEPCTKETINNTWFLTPITGKPWAGPAASHGHDSSSPSQIQGREGGAALGQTTVSPPVH